MSVIPELLLLVGLSGEARDVPEFDWHASEECPRSSEIWRQVEGLLIQPAPLEDLRVSGHLLRQRANYELVLEVSVGEQAPVRHELHGHDCEELGWLAARLIANSVDPFAYLAPAPPARSDPARNVPVIQIPQQRALTTREQHDVGSPDLARSLIQPSSTPSTNSDSIGRRTAPIITGLVAVDGSANFGVFPGPGGGPRVGLGVDVSKFRAVTAGSGWFGPGFRGVGDEADIGGQLRGWTLELGLCGRPGLSQLEFPICARAGAGQLIGTGRGSGVAVDTVRTEAQAWAWVGADASLEWWVRPRFGLFVSLGAAGTVARPVFHIAASDVRFETPPVFGRVNIGVTGRFGPAVRRVKDPRTQAALADMEDTP